MPGGLKFLAQVRKRFRMPARRLKAPGMNVVLFGRPVVGVSEDESGIANMLRVVD